jgi:catechol 2,3-dioxygenase-like lactoylglutathione lyase family enzyme
MDTATATREAGAAAVPMRFEVTTLPVADVDRAKAFYRRLGWRLDIDFKPTPDTRGVQFTPPGSQASIQFGQGTTKMNTGPLQGLFLVVDDIEAARDDLIRRGVDVSEIWHLEPGRGACPASIRSAAPTSAERRSRTPTATHGSCRRSRSDSRAAWK